MIGGGEGDGKESMGKFSLEFSEKFDIVLRTEISTEIFARYII